MTNIEWIAKGNTGCTFATLFAKKPESVGWLILTHKQYDRWKESYGEACIISVIFPEDWTAKDVRAWAKKDGFYEEYHDDKTVGLRTKMYNINRYGKDTPIDNETGYTSWVQYFGPDSHVPTRQAPQPMLMWTRKLSPFGFVKQVGFNGILHLAHAFTKHLTEKVADVLWNRAFVQTRKIIGHDLGLEEAAKTTWLKKDIE